MGAHRTRISQLKPRARWFERGRLAYLDFLIALLAEVASPTGHLCTSHGFLFYREDLLGLNLCKRTKHVSKVNLLDAPLDT